MPRVGGHFLSKTDCLDPTGRNSLCQQKIPRGLRSAFSEPAIVFRGASFISEPGQNNIVVTALQKTPDLPELVSLIGSDIKAVEGEIDRLKLSFGDVVAEKGDPFLARWQRRSVHIIAVHSGVLLFLLLLTTGKAKGQ